MRAGPFFLFVWCVLGAPAARSSEGLFATLQTTRGDIRIQLEYQRAPRTVANFVSLAEGTRAWLDVEGGRALREPFYNGLMFHRVASNFVIQTGAPGGISSRGPGYRFADEFHPELRHDRAGTVSMANRGPGSNGSQFFITLRPIPSLDFDQAPLASAHAVFGYVVEGLPVVSNISAVATSPPGDGRPLVEITITNVWIERVGETAQSFDPLMVTPRLPDVRGARCDLGVDAEGNYLLTWPVKPSHQFWAFGNQALEAERGWQSLTSSSFVAAGFFVSGLVTNLNPHFFSVVEVEYFQ